MFERPKTFPKAVPSIAVQVDAISIHVLTPEGETAAAQITRALAMPAQGVQHGGIVSARRMAGLGRSGRVVIVELPDSPTPLDLSALAELCELSGQVIALGQTQDIGLFRRLLAVGVTDYRNLPLDPNENLSEILGQTRVSTGPRKRAGRVTAIVAASGGAGGTLLAANLAWALSDRTGAEVALIDLDFEFGTLDLDLGLPPTPGLADALASPERVDETYLQATMTGPKPGLRVYSPGTTTPEPPPALTPERMTPLLANLRQSFDDIVLDLPRQALTARPDLARQFDRLLLVMSPGYGALRCRARIEAQVRDVVGAKIEILNILSHGRKDARLPAQELKRALSLELAAELPQDEGAVARASVQGRPVVTVEPRSPYAKSVIALADRIEGQRPAAKSLLRQALHRMF